VYIPRRVSCGRDETDTPCGGAGMWLLLGPCVAL